MPNWKKVIVSGSDARINSLFTSGHVTASGNISGSVTSTGSFGRVDAADSIYIDGVEVGAHPIIAADNLLNSDHFITFVDNSGDGSTPQQLKTDTSLTYNPNSNLLTTTTTNANIAAQVTLATETLDNDRYVIFGSGAGDMDLHIDAGILYNPSTNLLTTTVTNANIAGKITLSTETLNNERYVTFGSGAGDVDLHIDAGIRYNPSTNLLTTTVTNANVAGQVTLATETLNNERYVIFGSGTGDVNLKIDSGIRYNPSTNLLTTNVTNANIAAQVTLATETLNNERYVIFGSGAGDVDLKIDSGIRYNPSLNKLTTDVIGDLTGNADTATTATTVTITNNTGTNEDNAIVFTSGGDTNGGNIGLESNGSLTFNPNSGILRATTFAGTGSISIRPRIQYDTTTNSDFNVLLSGTSIKNHNVIEAGSKFRVGGTSHGLTFNPTTGTGGTLSVANVTATNFTGNLIGNADTATLATTATNVVITDNESTNEDNAIVFVANADTDGSTSIGLESDGNLTYNPSTGRLTATQLAGDGTNITNLPSPPIDTIGSNFGDNNRVITAAGANAVNAEPNLTFDGSTLAVTGAVTVSGNLSVSGTTTTINSTNLDIGDRIITLNAGSAAGDGGIYVNDASTTETGSLLWDVSDNRWIGGLKDNEVKLVTLSSTDTLTNKTLTSPVISTITTNSNTLTLPTDGAGTLARTSDNVASATILATARNIGGVSFNGSADINLPGVNTSGTQDTSGNAATATALANARTIGGVSFDGTGNIDLPGVNTGGNQNTSGTAATATALANARTIGGVSFDGTGNIDLPGVNTGGNQDTSGNAATATTSVTSSLTQNIEFTRFGGAVTDDYHVMLGGDAGATGGSGLRIPTQLKATSAGSQNHLKYNVNTGKLSGVQTLEGTASIATNVHYIAHSKTSSFNSPNFGGFFYDVPLIKMQNFTTSDPSEHDGSSFVGHFDDSRPTLGVGENRIRYNAVTMHLSGSVSSSASFANIISVGSSSFNDLTVTGNISAGGTVDGRDLQTDGTKLDGIEANADVTDATNVTSAGAVMDSEVTNLSFVKGLTGGISNGNVLVVNANVADDDFLKIDGTSVEGRTVAEVLSDLNVEAGADVTDATNVTAAGALMDSEVTDLTGIKGVTISTLATKTGAETLTNKTLTSPDINGGTIDESDITVGTGKTLDVSNGTLTLADNQISGNKVEGGTIASITISQLGGALDANNQAITNVDINSGDISGTDINVTGQTLTLDNDQISGDKVEGGTIASTTITSLASTNVVTTHLTASNDISSSITSTGSFGFLNVPGDAVIGGTVRAQEFHTEFVSASIIYESGSSQFGDTLDDTHDFIGTMSITGSLTGSFNTSASFGYVRAHGNMEALGTGSFRVLEVVEQVQSQGTITAPGFIATGDSSFNDDVNLGGDRTHNVNLRSHITSSNDINISGSFTSTGSFGKLEIAKTGSFGRVHSTNMTGTILTAAQPNITSLGTLSSIDIDGGNIDGTTIATSDITVGNSKTLDVSAGTLTTSATQNLNIIQGASSNIDIGSFELRAETLESDVTTGTAPLTVASTTLVSNLNADKLDGEDGSHYLDFGNFVIDNDEIPIAKLASDSVSYGGVEVTLGNSDTTPAFNLQDATAYPGDSSLITTGTVTTGVWNSTFGTAASASISGAFSADSASFSTRVTALKTDSGSFSTRTNALETTMVSEQANIDTLQTTLASEQTNIDNLQSDSGSFSTRVTALKTDSGSFSTRVTALKTDSGSFSTRVTNLEDNTNDVTFATGLDYLSLSGQEITMNQIDLTTDVTGALPLSNTSLVAGTNITLDTNTLNVDDAFLKNDANDSTSGTITAAGFVSNGNISGSATATGSFGRVDVVGNIIPKVHNVSELGSPTNRWANIYSADLQLSNEDNEIGNEIDGTKGSWTIQEGEDDLYLLNRKNGKKYKFKLEEIT